MSDFRITNCHTHMFTDAHVPKYYPSMWLWIFKRVPGLVPLLGRLLRLVGQTELAETLFRLHQFQTEANHPAQADILRNMRKQYPGNTRFVVLPMDMAPAGHGPVRKGLAAQHDELSAMARSDEFLGHVIPFATIHPDAPGAVAEFRRAIDSLKFRGLKLYPRLGFAPDHPVLMKEVYPLMQDRGLPVMTHCSRGGVQGKAVSWHMANRYTEPAAFIPVMSEFPDLRVCLAHFGGPEDWRRYVEDGIDPDDPDARRNNWQVAIRDMIGCGAWPGLWTDISYTLFHFDDNLPFLRLFLQGEAGDERVARLRSRVLFGSDFYMTRRERLSERAVCFRLRNALGEDLFRQLATINPEVWLGERPDPLVG